MVTEILDAGGVRPASETPTRSQPLPLMQRFVWSLGAAAENCLGNGIVVLAMPIYNLGLGVSAVWLGWALAVPRVLDAIIDPLIGNLSDNTRSRWGRRRPYIALGTVVSALLFALMWMPPFSWSHRSQFYYFCAITFPYMIGFALFAIPYGALGMELSEDPAERTRIMGWRSLLANAAALLFPWLYKWSLLLGQNAPPGMPREVYGVRYVGMGLAALIAVCGLSVVFFCRERVAAQSQAPIRMGRAIKLTMRNRPFLLLTGVILCVYTGMGLVTPLLLYIGVSYICQGDKDLAAKISGISGTLYSVGGLLASLCAGWISARWGKRRVMLSSLVVVALTMLASLVCYTPRFPYLQLLPSFILCPAMIFVQVLANSLVADICDVDELESGLRREGMFGAVNAVILKVGLAGTSVLGGYIIQFSGFIDGQAVQSAEVLWRMRLMYAMLPTLLIMVALWLAWLFPINERTMKQVREQLDRRRAEAR